MIFWTNIAQKRVNMAAILKFKMAAEDVFGQKMGDGGIEKSHPCKLG